MTCSPAIVIGLDSLPGLQTARILFQRGVPVIAIARFPTHYSCRTNACRRILFADTQSTALIEQLRELGPTLPAKAVLFPCTDMSVLLVSRNRTALAPWYHVVLPSAATVETLLHKVSFHEFIQATGLPFPTTFVLRSTSDAHEAADHLSFPAILKPSVREPRWTAHSPNKVYPLASKQDFLARYAQCSQWTKELIVQEWIGGPDMNLFSFNGYFDRYGQSLTTFIARKIRQWPPHAGITSLGIECRNDAVLEAALTLFRKVRFTGLGYAEMKYDMHRGVHCVLEVNVGRPTVRSALAEGAGVELIYTMYCDALGLPLPQNRTQQYGTIKWWNIHHDLRSSWYAWRRGELSFIEWGSSIRGPKVHAVFSWSDPLPFFADIADTCIQFIRKRIMPHKTPNSVW